MGLNTAAPWMVDVSRTIATNLLNAIQSDAKILAENTAKAALARGRVFGLAAYHDEAIASFKEALALDPSLNEAAARLTIHQIRVKQNGEALETASKLVQVAPNFVLQEMTSGERISSYTLLGNALIANGYTNDAIQAYLAALRASVSETTASARLAQVYISIGDDKSALALADAFTYNPRFHDLSAVLKLARDGQATLPHIDLNHVYLDFHGRPLSVEGDARLAPVVVGDDSWCANAQDVLKDDALS